jgi:hypothetical protein
MKRTMIIGLLAMALGGSSAQAAAPAPQVGDVAPDFSLPYATRDSVAKDTLDLKSLVG